MKILISIILNGLILFAIAYFLSGNDSVWAGVTLGCSPCSLTSLDAMKTYIIGGIILWILNVVIRPVLKVLALPLFFLFFGLVVFLTNAVVLFLFGFIINNLLQIPGVGYEIDGNLNFIIAVAIFTVFNTLYSLLFFK